MQGIDGGAVYSGFLFSSSGPRGPMSSNEERWDAISEGAKEGLEKLSEKACTNIRNIMPEHKPFRLTHGDLTNANVMVEDGNLSGIIDWEWAGYFPVWWEYTVVGAAYSQSDSEWKEMLREDMHTKYPEGLGF
ncbi:hypothetical protein BDD12DRAFT_977880 [Trichophaea hybrida]|nr:hypothetical protein BDD12DRAFT_977880 [Trichophaea hybrida]